jgi:hypothetical protein
MTFEVDDTHRGWRPDVRMYNIGITMKSLKLSSA